MPWEARTPPFGVDCAASRPAAVQSPSRLEAQAFWLKAADKIYYAPFGSGSRQSPEGSHRCSEPSRVHCASGRLGPAFPRFAHKGQAGRSLRYQWPPHRGSRPRQGCWAVPTAPASAVLAANKALSNFHCSRRRVEVRTRLVEEGGCLGGASCQKSTPPFVSVTGSYGPFMRFLGEKHPPGPPAHRLPNLARDILYLPAGGNATRHKVWQPRCGLVGPVAGSRTRWCEGNGCKGRP